MSSIPTLSKEPNHPIPRTLGDLLYARRGRNHVPEAEWVSLLQAIAAGDQRALHTLHGRLHRIVFTLILRIVKSRESAEELTVDVFYDVWKRAATYDSSGGTVVGWVMNQARSRAIDRLRFDQRKKRVNPYPVDGREEAVGDDAEKPLEAEDQQRLIRTALLALSDTERQALETAYFSECTYAEAAVRLNQPLGTVKTQIRSALAKLRQVLTAGSEEP